MNDIEVIDNFNESLALSANSDSVKQFDGRVTISWRLAALPTLVLPMIPLVLSHLSGTSIQMPVLYSFALTLYWLAVFVAIGILYQHAKNENNVKQRIQIAVFCVFCLFFGLPGITIFSLQQAVSVSHPGYVAWNTGIFLWYIGLVLWGFVLDDIVSTRVTKVLKGLLRDGVKPFSEILAGTFTNHNMYIRTFAFSACLLYASILWVLLNPDTWVLLLYILFIILMTTVIRPKQDYERFYYGLNQQIDLATYSLVTSKQLWEFGVRNYRVHYKSTMFYRFVSLFTTELYPDAYAPVLIIHPTISHLDISRIQAHLNENWNQDFRWRRFGWFVSPFRSFEGRVLIDSHVWNAEKLLWWTTDSRFAIALSGDELHNNPNVIVGDFADMLLEGE